MAGRVLGIVGLLVVAMLVEAVPARGAERVNVLFIAVDDLRPELGCYGVAGVRSPNIDELAKRGLKFERAYCQLALCNPSRSSLLSGRRPETLGIYDLKTFVRTRNPDVVTLPELFKDNGYVSLSFGKIFHTGNGNHDDPKSYTERPWHPGAAKAAAGAKKPKGEADPDADPHADDLPYEAPECADDDLADGMIAAKAIEALRANKEKAFFIGVGFHRPHMPFVAPKKYWDLYDPKKIELAANQNLPEGAPAFASNEASELRRYKGVPKKGPIPEELQRACKHGYLASVSFVDAQVGRVLAELEKLGLQEKTVVVLWGDHGYQLGEHGTWNKRTDWEIATRVPLIVAAPGEKYQRGVGSRALVEAVDVYPTLAELAGLKAPEKLEGVSFVPLLTEPSRNWKRAAFSIYQKRVEELGGPAQGRAMVTERYRLIEWAGKGAGAEGKRVYELYDHEKDPGENVNVAGYPENEGLVKQLAAQLKEGWRGAVPTGSSKSETRNPNQ